MAGLDIIVGGAPIAVRQALLTGNAMAKAQPSLLGTDLVILGNDRGIYFYGDDTTRLLTSGDKGGEFSFDLSEAVLLLELHLELGAGSVVDVMLVDPDGTHPRELLAGQSGVGDTYVFPRNKEVYLLPGQKLQINETSTGVPAASADKFATLYVAQSWRT